MKYISTRNSNSLDSITSAQAIKRGLAPDGGLYLPENIPAIDLSFISSLVPLSYSDRAVKVLSLFLDDYSENELRLYADSAYGELSFPGGAAPVVRITDGGNRNLYSLELWHGPTSAFKDMALQLMPRLLSGAIIKTGETRNALVLVATSGDTGKAALEGYRDVDRVMIKVFYPVDGVSRVQKLQMATQAGNNVDVCAIRGNFDSAQSGVKRIFSDNDVAARLDAAGYFLSSANSINWGRLVPQIVYYFSSYCDLVSQGAITLGDKINVSVPTGNFGNIFAAYTAKLMGLPVNRLICASNSNNVLTDFISNGKYDIDRAFHMTISPSMDILISSNLERLLYLTTGPSATCEYMKHLSETGSYSIDADSLAAIRSSFAGYYATEDDTMATIRDMYENCSYLCDTHTAVGIHCAETYMEQTGDDIPMLVVSTASPFKFAGDVYRALTDCKPPEDFAALGALADLTGSRIPAPLAGLDKRGIRFDRVCDPSGMTADLFAHM